MKPNEILQIDALSIDQILNDLSLIKIIIGEKGFNGLRSRAQSNGITISDQLEADIKKMLDYVEAIEKAAVLTQLKSQKQHTLSH